MPPCVRHQEINASDAEPLSCVLARSGQEAVLVNLDMPAVDESEEVRWVDNIHPAPKRQAPLHSCNDFSYIIDRQGFPGDCINQMTIHRSDP